jgi:2-aminomuconate deaminase
MSDKKANVTSDNNSIINSKKAPEPVGAYAHARIVGELIFLAGIGPRTRGSKVIPGTVTDASGHVISHDITVQTEAVIENVKTVLEDCGSSLNKIVDVTVFLTNMKNDFDNYNKVYAKYFSGIQATRTTVEVKSLPTPIAVEFKVIATK